MKYQLKYLLLCTSLCVFSFQLLAQSRDRVLQRASDRARYRGEHEIDRAIDRGFDKAEQDRQQKAQSASTRHTSNSNGSDRSYSSSATNSNPNYTTGEQVLFQEDFSKAKLASGAGNWHFYEYDVSDKFERPHITAIPAGKGQWLKMPRKGFAFPNGYKSLPEQFTLELDLYADAQSMSEMEGGFKVIFSSKNNRADYDMYFDPSPAIKVDIHPHGSSKVMNVHTTTHYNSKVNHLDMVLFDQNFSNAWKPNVINKVVIVRKGAEITLFVNGKELMYLPNALPNKVVYNLIFATNLWGDGMYVSNISVTQ